MFKDFDYDKQDIHVPCIKFKVTLFEKLLTKISQLSNLI